MKNKGMIMSRDIMIFGMTAVALLISTHSQMQMVSASVEGGSTSCNPSPYRPCPPPTNAEQSQPPNIDPCISDPERCKPPNNSEQSQGSSQGTAPDSNSSSGTTSNSNQEAINHINQAQSALQNGDTTGAQQHLDSAQKSLGCTPYKPCL